MDSPRTLFCACFCVGYRPGLVSLFFAPTSGATALRTMYFTRDHEHELESATNAAMAQTASERRTMQDPDLVLLMNPSTPPEELMRIAQARPDLHAALAQSPAIYPELLEWLATSQDPTVQQAVQARLAGQAPIHTGVTEETQVFQATDPTQVMDPVHQSPAPVTPTAPSSPVPVSADAASGSATTSGPPSVPAAPTTPGTGQPGEPNDAPSSAKTAAKKKWVAPVVGGVLALLIFAVIFILLVQGSKDEAPEPETTQTTEETPETEEETPTEEKPTEEPEEPEEPVAPEPEDLEEISTGDFASLVGLWQSEDGMHCLDVSSDYSFVADVCGGGEFRPQFEGKGLRGHGEAVSESVEAQPLWVSDNYLQLVWHQPNAGTGGRPGLYIMYFETGADGSIERVASNGMACESPDCGGALNEAGVWVRPFPDPNAWLYFAG